MNRTDAIAVQKEIEALLKKNSLHYNVKYVRNPSLRFIDIEISIKVTGEKGNEQGVS